MSPNFIAAAWESLPEIAREWLTKIAVTLGIAILWHVWVLRDQQHKQTTTTNDEMSVPQREQRSKAKGVSPLVLDPLPQDLVLEEKIEPVIPSPPAAERNDEDSSSSHSPSGVDDASGTEEDITPSATDTSAASTGDRGHLVASQATTTTHGNTPTATSSSSRNASTTTRIEFKNKTAAHPGLEKFWYWCDVECSLFRIYSLGRKDGTAVHPPYIPRSRAGHVKVSLRVQNLTHKTIHVYWINYKGKDLLKGTMKPRARWMQQTWIEHPWIFKDAETDEVLLYYIPDRIIPTCADSPTIDDEDSEMGVHRFNLVNAPPDSPFYIHVEDPVLPFPAKDHIRSVEKAVDWTLLHMHRMDYMYWDTLVKYLTNILHQPGKASYRQIRIENRRFNEAIWNTPARGLMLAIGFVEQGAFVELGTAKRLTAEQSKQLSTLLFSIAIWRKRDQASTQPAGADGYGRAGFGRAGAMS